MASDPPLEVSFRLSAELEPLPPAASDEIINTESARGKLERNYEKHTQEKCDNYLLSWRKRDTAKKNSALVFFVLLENGIDFLCRWYFSRIMSFLVSVKVR